MNFELSEKLENLLKESKLEKAIELAESELQKLPETDFHKILGKNLLHLTTELRDYLTQFSKSAEKFYKGSTTGLLSKVFNKTKKSTKSLKAIYCEMNGFTINYDLWFIDLFAYSFYNKGEGLDWLADFEYDSENSMTISGFEDLQKVYQDYMENEKYKDKNLEKAGDICELIIVLRLQELFKQTYLENMDNQFEWIHIPILATAHDYEMIYKTI